MRWISFISSGQSIQMHKNTPSSQVHIEHSPGETTYWVTDQTSVNLGELKSYQESFLLFWPQCFETRYQFWKKKKNCKKHKHMEVKQYISKWWTGYWINQKGNRKISRNKWQWKPDNSKPMGCSKSSSMKEVYSNTIPPQETRKVKQTT